MRNRILLFALSAVFLLLFSSSLHAGTPGSGTATIDPPSDVTAGSQGTWTITYTAEDYFNAGVVLITIPVGWTAPQDGAPNSPGYITVSTDDPACSPTLSIGGQVITINADTLNIGKVLTLVYGDTAGEANPNAKATAQTTAEDSVQFLVESDSEMGNNPALIASSPTIDVVAGPIVKLEFISSPFTFPSTGEAGPLILQTQDQYGNPSAPIADTQINLTSTCAVAMCSRLGGASFSEVDSIIQGAGNDTVSFYYRDTVVGTPTITASAEGQSWTAAQQQQTVDPGPITQLVFISDPNTFECTSEAGPIAIQTQDQNENPSLVSSNQQINLSSTCAFGCFSVLGGENFSPVDSIVMPAGTHTTSFYYRDTRTGTPTITASAQGQPWEDTQQQMAEPGPPHHLTISPSDTTMTAGDFIAYTISVVDSLGNATGLLNDRVVLLESDPSGDFYLPSDHSTPIALLIIAAGEQDTLLDYRNTDANGGIAHILDIRTFDPLSPTLVGIDSVTVAPASVDTAVSTISATTPVVADGSPSTVTVTVKDAFANPIDSVTVTLSATGSASVNDPAGPTNPDGVAVGSGTNLVAETVIVRAVADGDTLSDSATVVFVPGDVDADSSLVAATSPVTADGVDKSIITVTARDANGNPVSGASVTLSVSSEQPEDVLTQPGGVTGPNGQVQGELRSTVTAMPRYVKAVINSVSIVDSAEVVFEAGPAAEFVWTHDGNVVAGVFEDVNLEVLDAQGNRVIAYSDSVFLETTTQWGEVEWAYGTGAKGTIVPLPTDTLYAFDVLDNGIVNLRVKSTLMESIRLRAYRGLAFGESGPLNVHHAAPDSLVIDSGNNQTAEVNTAVGSPLVVKVKDAFGNWVDTTEVTFTVLAGGGLVDVDTTAGGPQDSVAVSAANGEAVCEKWVLGQQSGSDTVRAHMQSGSVTSVNFSATGVAGTGTQIELTPSSKGVTVGSGTEVTAVLKDQFDNVVSGKRVDIFIKDSVADGTLEPNPADPNPTYPLTQTARYGFTDSAGEISVVYRAPLAAALIDSLDAEGDGAPRDSVDDVVYTSTASGATDLKIVWLSSDTAQAGQSFLFKIQAVDGNDNVDTGNSSLVNISGQMGSTLEFSENDFGPTITQVTLINGEKQVYGRGTLVGRWEITASDDASILGDGTEYVVIEDAAVVDHYVVSTVDSVMAGASFNVSVEARDAYGNRVMGAGNNIDLIAVSPADSLPRPDTLLVGTAPLVAGRAIVGENYVRAENILVWVRDASLKEGFSNVLKVKPAGAHQIVYVSGDSTGVVAGSSALLVSRVWDVYENNVPGVSVVFSVLSGGGNVTPGSENSGSDGMVTVTLTTGVAAGENRVRGTIDDGNPPHLETVEYTVQTIASNIHHYTVTPEKTTIAAGEVITVEVKAFDINNNLLEEDSTTGVILGSTTGNAQYGSATDTLVGGIYSTTVWDTVAEPDLILTVDTQGGGPSDSSAVVTVTNAPAYELAAIAGDTSGVEVGFRQRLWVEVLDQYGNVVPGQGVNFTIINDPDGTAELRDALPDTTDGITSTNSAGRAWVDLITSNEAGDNLVRASILDGTPPNLETYTFIVSTQAGEIAYYAVTPDATGGTAGVPIGITVRAFDSNDNPVPDNTTSVEFFVEPPDTGTFAPSSPIVLQAGTLTTAVTVTEVGDFQVRARTEGDTATAGLSPPITIGPNVPWGLITATASPETITANGVSTSIVTSDSITDAYGNVVSEGTFVTVAITDGAIISSDQDPGTPGNQQETDAFGIISFQVQSSTTQGLAAISMNSVAGSASGVTQVYFAQPPTLVCPSPPIPSAVAPGDSVAFRIFVRNTSQTNVTLSTATTFDFTDGAESFSAPLESPIFIGAGLTDTLRFVKQWVHGDMNPGSYSPVINLAGTDQYGAVYSEPCLLPPNSLIISSIRIESITAKPFVSRGTTDTVIVAVKNLGPLPATIETVDLTFSFGSYGVRTALGLPRVIGFNETAQVTVLVPIGSSSPIGMSTIDAFVSGQTGGQTVFDLSLAPYLPLPEWTIQAGATIEYIAGSLQEPIVSSGNVYAFSVELKNSGDATVTLDTLLTKLSFTDGIETYEALLAQTAALAGGATQRVEFDSTMVPLSFIPGDYDVEIHLEGVENGGPFVDSVRTSDKTDYLTVVTPASVSPVLGSLSPDRVSRSTSVFFEIEVQNTGGASVVLNPDSTRFSFAAGAHDVPLDVDLNTVISKSGSTVLRFNPQMVTAPATIYFPSVRLYGTENGLPFDEAFVLQDTLYVQDAPDISIVLLVPSQPRITADRSAGISIRMDVSNSGQATVDFDSAKVRFILGGIDRTDEFIITSPVSFEGGINLPGDSTDSVLFGISDNPSNLMSTGNMTIEGTLWVTDPNGPTEIVADTDLGGKGSLIVESPAVLAIESITPSQDPVSALQTKPFKIRMAVRNVGESAITVALDRDSTYLSFTPSGGGWEWTIEDTLAGGGRTIGGGEVDTVRFDVSKAGGIADLNVIDGVVEAEEKNSGWHIIHDTSDNGSGTILVQSQAAISITSVTPSRPTVTQESGADWTIRIDVTNAGEAELALTLPESLTVTFQDTVGGTVYSKPSTFEGGGVNLTGGASGELVVDVDSTGAFSSRGSKTISVRLAGVELNSGRPVSGIDSGSVTVQAQPDVVYLPNSLDPDTVSSGSVVGFQIGLVNVVPDGATIHLDPSLTKMRFGAGLFEASLDPSSIDPIPGTKGDTLVFVATTIDTLIPPGLTPIELDLHWTENGATGSKLITISGELLIQDAPRLNIVQIRSSQPTVTANQAKTWHITMILENNGETGVDLDLSDGMTDLTLKTLGDVDVSSEYIIPQPTALDGVGGTILPGDATDSLIFDVTQTGTTRGLILISGEATGTDVISSEPVFDDTFDGGAGNVTVQSEAILNIAGITPEQPTATAGQTSGYKIKMAVENLGGSSVDLSLDSVSTKLTFSKPGGWSWTIDSTLVSGGRILAGGATDTVVFNIQRTGDSTDTTLIGGQLKGFEINSDRLVDTTEVDVGSIIIQSPASLAINSVAPSRTTVTEDSPVDWSITVQVENTGGSDVSLILPDGATAAIESDTSGTLIQKPSELQSGGTLLPGGGVGELVFIVDQTGLFSGYGSKAIQVDLIGRELNSNQNVPGTGFGNVTIQAVPTVQYVSGSLEPDSVSKGEEVQFKVTVKNPNSDAAAIHLDPLSTKLQFAAGQFTALLDPLSPASIAGGDSVELVFDPTTIDTAISTGPETVSVELQWLENGRPDSDILTIDNELLIQAPSDLQITQIYTNQPTVTAQQSKSWFISMVVANNGGAGIILDLDEAATHPNFELLGIGDVSDEYTVNYPPTGFLEGDILKGGVADTLVFEVSGTGSSTGTILISGSVEGRDVNTSEIIKDEGGSALVLVQSKAVLNIAGITTPSKVTEGQTAPFEITMAVQNMGESEVRVALHKDSTSITFAEPDGWMWNIEPALVGGGDVIAGGVIDTVIFSVQSTGDSTGMISIDGRVQGFELNSDRFIDTTVVNVDSILVQTKPQLEVTSTVLAAPNPPYVNTNQDFQVATVITNNGEAEAESVYIHIEKSGGSILPETLRVIANLSGGGSTAADTFAVTAAAVADTETFTVVVDSALDANSGQGLFQIITPALDDTAVAFIQNPAVLAIDGVFPSQDRVTRQQTTDWSITIALQNGGDAGLQLTPATADDIGFFIGTQEQIGYAVLAPDTFLSGATDWRIMGGATDTLVYTVASTGSNTGTVRIDANLTAIDLNNPGAGLLQDLDSSTVQVEAPSGLFIDSTYAVAPNTLTNRAFVNTNQPYSINVKIKNTGEAVHRVRVSLRSDGSTLPVPQLSDPLSLATDDSTTYSFSVTAASSAEPFETFTAKIDSATSVNTQLPVNPGPSVDDQEFVTTQVPADLRLSFDITAPLEATDDTLSTNQSFDVTAIVSNNGEAEVEGTGRVRIEYPSSFVLIAGAAIRNYSEDESIIWTLRAPNTASLGQEITCTIIDTLIDRNIDQPAFVSKRADKITVDVLPAATLANPILSIIDPGGATDNTISTDQEFKVRVEVTTNAQTENIEAKLILPAVFQPIGPSTKLLGDGIDGPPMAATFRVLAPSSAFNDTIKVTFTGIDENTSANLAATSPGLYVVVIEKASLTLAADITAPPEARDNIVTIGSSFTIEATVTNASGHAGINTLITTPLLKMRLQGGYTFVNPADSVQNFDLGIPVAWEVKAPSDPTGPQPIIIEIDSIPVDENSELPAEVAVGQVTIPIQTESAVVTVDDVTEALNFETKVVQGGAQNIGLFGIEIRNPGDKSAPTAEVVSIRFTVEDGNRNPLSSPDRTLSGFSVDVGGGAGQIIVSNLSVNPIVVDFSGAGNARFLPPGDNTNIAVSVSILKNPADSEIRLVIQSGSHIEVRDTSSGELLSVVDKTTNQPIGEGVLKSRPLVILSSQFSEYAHNYPNPFRAGSEETRIAYFLDSPGDVTVRIFSLTGDLVWEQAYRQPDPHTQAGPQEILWDGRNLKKEVIRNGIYICRIQAGPNQATFRIAVAK
ncbi:MAG: hypothetical protein GTO51_01270 [Candidatus Latescibacteria bacterium]|nr:hypothetical protein [Candidatus Latescibacterota bacterium]NIM21630.1 hypothetical protein [Candidatus Latescibacterota bacterium]NIM64609.1 hypothetical protein [Candidatus Latescibacterota bacterium]NIO01124.1 hypothetical protein [Candidatus Latescibacterota bacterium]NIO27517.1 hypothetical protein [Candidatus Latescibacterota bacterium]